MVEEMMTPRRRTVAALSAVSTLQPEMLPWNAARYFYSMADRVMLV
jgi:hypothetical protein